MNLPNSIVLNCITNLISEIRMNPCLDQTHACTVPPKEESERGL